MKNRKRAKEYKGLKKWLILVAIPVLLLLIGVFVFKTMTIRDIVIIGNKHLTEQDVKNLLAVKKGNSILYPTSKTLYERVKKTPWIKDAIIRKDLNGTITIYIKEAVPIALAIYENNVYLLDKDSNVLERVSGEMNDSSIFLPVIKNIDPFKNRDTLYEAVNLVNFLNDKGFVQKEDKITITGSNPDDLTLFINDFSIIVGKGDLESKFLKFKVVSEEIKKRNLTVQYVDLRFPDKVVVKPVETGRGNE